MTSPRPQCNYSRVSSFLVLLLLEFRDVAQVTQVISIIPLIRLRIEIETTVIKVGDRPPLLLIFIIEVPSHDALSATAASHDLREPELVVAELKNWRTPDHDVYEVAAQLFDERFRRSGEEILDLVLSLPSRRRLAATADKKARS